MLIIRILGYIFSLIIHVCLSKRKSALVCIVPRRVFSHSYVVLHHLMVSSQTQKKTRSVSLYLLCSVDLDVIFPNSSQAGTITIR